MFMPANEMFTSASTMVTPIFKETPHFSGCSSCTSPHGLISPPVVVGKININSTFTLMCGNKKSTCNDFKEILIFAQFRKQKQKAENSCFDLFLHTFDFLLTLKVNTYSFFFYEKTQYQKFLNKRKPTRTNTSHSKHDSQTLCSIWVVWGLKEQETFEMKTKKEESNKLKFISFVVLYGFFEVARWGYPIINH